MAKTTPTPTGFAYKTPAGILDIKTAADTEQGCKVNAILMHLGIMPTSDWNADRIHMTFCRLNGTIVRAKITEI